VAEGKVELVDRLNAKNEDISLNEVANRVTTAITSTLRTVLPVAI
jgi:hypothetical protein